MAKRRLPEKCPAPPAVAPKTELFEGTIHLITPMFGGGVRAGEPDPITPIRGPSIRGQLRFWWRATRGAAFADFESMHQREAEIWGSTENASPVTIEIDCVDLSPLVPCAEYKWNAQVKKQRLQWHLPFGREKRESYGSYMQSTALSYVAFPFQGQPPQDSRDRHAAPKKMPSLMVPSGSFRLRISAPDELKAEVDAALWAWCNFGGLGARTRRGCGALFCKEFAPSGQITADWASRLLADRPDHSLPPSWPTMGSLFIARRESTIDAWQRIIGHYHDFRQGIGFARNPGPGRSHYPEPESIRKATNCHGHPPSGIPNEHFPRAELGLPIVFQFKGRGEPPTTTLYPRTTEDANSSLDRAPVRRSRMASPFVLKPLAVDPGHAIAIALFLRTEQLNEVELVESGSAEAEQKSFGIFDSSSIRNPQLAKYARSPLRASTAGSALEAWKAYLSSHDFTEFVLS